MLYQMLGRSIWWKTPECKKGSLKSVVLVVQQHKNEVSYKHAVSLKEVGEMNKCNQRKNEVPSKWNQQSRHTKIIGEMRTPEETVMKNPKP